MDMFSALADPTRRNILEILASQGGLSATDISDRFFITPQAVSQHLKVLRETKLVDMEKHAQKRVYRINAHTLSQFQEWVKKLESALEERFTALDVLLARGKRKEKHV